MVDVFYSLENLPDSVRHGAVAIGNFDGVHLGHANLISQLCQAAQAVSGPAVVFTFHPSPASILRPGQAPQALTWPARRAELLGLAGANAVVIYPTDPKLLSLTAAAFYDEIIIKQLAAAAVVEGPNFQFGRDRTGDVDLLAQWCDRDKILFRVATACETDGEMVSSTRIRKALISGQIEQANAWLTAPYRIQGIVSRGASRGRTIGFPTANLESIPVLVPAAGVYAGKAWVKGRTYTAAANIGTNPTFADQQNKAEVYLLDFNGEIYGETVAFEFRHRIRDTVSFDSADSLAAQLHRDIAATRKWASSWGDD